MELLVILQLRIIITYFMSRIKHEYSSGILQFWAPKFEEGGCYITTLDQPFAVGCLEKGLASFRNRSMEHVYYVDGGAKDEQAPPALPLIYTHRCGYVCFCAYKCRHYQQSIIIKTCSIRILSRLLIAIQARRIQVLK
ncbi:hypothetical protein ACP275_05G087900 [Erythranthe tilingii]